MAKNREQRLLSDLKAMEADYLEGTSDFDAFLDRWAETISNIQAALAEDFLSQHALQCIQETFSTVLAPAAIVHQAISQLESGIVDDIADAFDDLDLFGPDEGGDDYGFVDEPDPPNYLEDWLVANIAYPFATSSNPTPEFLKLVGMSKTSFVSWLLTARQSIGWNLLAEELVHGDSSSMRKLCKIVFHGASTNSSALLQLAESSRTLLLSMKPAIVEYCTPPPPPWLEDVKRLLEELRDQPGVEWDEEFDWERPEYHSFSWEEPLHSKPQKYMPSWIMEEEEVKPRINSPSPWANTPLERKASLHWKSSPTPTTGNRAATGLRDGDNGTHGAVKPEANSPPKDEDAESRTPWRKTKSSRLGVHPQLDAGSDTRTTVPETPMPLSNEEPSLHIELMCPPRVAGMKRKLDDCTNAINVSEPLHLTLISSVILPYHNALPSPISSSPTLEDAVVTRPTKRTRLDATPEPPYNFITPSISTPNNRADSDIVASPLFCPSSPSFFASPDASSPLSASSGSDAGSPYQLSSPPAQDHFPVSRDVQRHNLHNQAAPSILSVLRDPSILQPYSDDGSTTPDPTLSDPQKSLDLLNQLTSSSLYDPSYNSKELSFSSSYSSIANSPLLTLHSIASREVLVKAAKLKNSNCLDQAQVYKGGPEDECQESPSRPSLSDIHIERKRKRSPSVALSTRQTLRSVTCLCKTQSSRRVYKNRKTRIRRGTVPRRFPVPALLSIDSVDQACGLCLSHQPTPVLQILHPAGEADFRPRKRANLAQRDYSLSPDP